MKKQRVVVKRNGRRGVRVVRRKEEPFTGIPNTLPYKGPAARKELRGEVKLDPAKYRELKEARERRRLARVEKQQKAIELRKAGVSYQVIAESLGFPNVKSAYLAVTAATKHLQVEAARDVLLLDLQRLDEYQMRCTERLRSSGDLHQIDRLMRIMEMRYRLLGVGPETQADLQKMFGVNQNSVTNNGVMVVQGTERDFVTAMMKAVGIDPDSPEQKAYVESLQHKQGDDPKDIIFEAEQIKAIEGPPLGEDEVIDAEIVE